MKHSAMAMVLATGGETERAVSELKRALKLDPFDAVALTQAKSLGITVTVPKTAIPGHP
jgi:hypothetical protein